MKKATALVVLLSLLVLASVALAADAPAPAPAPAAAGDAPAAPEPPKWGTKVGDKLKPFSLPTPLSKGTVSLDGLAKTGKDSVLIFMQTACSLCVSEVRDFSSSAEDLEGKVNVYLVSVDYDAARLEPYKKGYNVPFDIIHDKEADLLESFGFTSTPCIGIFDANGAIKEKFEGYDKAKVKGLVKGYAKGK